VSTSVVLGGALVGLGLFLAIWLLVPSRPHLAAALARLGGDDVSPLAGRRPARAAARQLAAAVPWLPVPAEDLAILGQDRETWLARKVGCGLGGLVAIPLLTTLVVLSGRHVSWQLPAAASIGLAIGMFFLPDLRTRANARQRRTDFRHALTSYLDLVKLERGAGAGPTEALESAAVIGGGWEFSLIATALDQARRTNRPPWEGLGDLARRIGVREVADLADIAEVAGQEGARILETLAARAESMRAEALASARATAGSRSTTMVIPVALLGAGFLLLIIYPVVSRALSPG
jgi:Flp pilus assembly protein TadB